MRRGFLTAAVLGSMASMASVAKAADIPWKEDAFFDETAADQNIRLVLSHLLDRDGLKVDFAPEVKGNVTVTFTHELLQAAFNKLIEENDLDYSYNDQTKTVTIKGKGQVKPEFIILNLVKRSDIDSIKKNFQLNVEPSYDPATQSVMLKGDQEQVDKLKALISQIETARAEKDKSDAEQRTAASASFQAQAEGQNKQAEADLKAYRLEQERRAQAEIASITVKVIPLHYASVGPVRVQFQGENVTIPGVIDTLNNLLGVTTAKAAAQDESGQNKVLGLASNPESALVGQTGNGPSQGGEFRRESPVAEPGPSGDFHGTISADLRTNSVIVRGTPHEIAEVEALVPKLDRPAEQVEIEAIIAQTTQGTLQQLGLRFGSDNLAISSGGAIGGAVSTLGTSSNIAPTLASGALTQVGTSSGGVSSPSSTVSPLSLLPTGSGTVASFLYRGADFALSAQLNALEQNNKAHVLSSPRVVTLDNIAAKITSDGTTFVPTSTGANSAGAFLQIPAGLTLKITPSVLRRDDVGEENMVRLVIEAENTQVQTQAGGSASRAGQSIQTQVIIPDRSTFIMGGLTSDNRTENLDRVPLLADLPLLGELFKLRDSEQALNEVLFFITPRLVPRADLYAKDVAEKRYLQNERAQLDRTGAEIRTQSQLLNLNTKTLEEDE
jgi:type II secretory pathway component GspD/PulD (secretin)